MVTEPLHTGVDQLSQTYRSRVTQQNRESINVIVKLFQQSLLPYPSLENIVDELSKGDWISATELAEREAWAYDKMAALQGTTIPHSYGFYVFRIPSGEEVIGHVMEEIGGFETTVYLEKNVHNSDAVWALADATAWALHAIHCEGVVHYDMRHRNMHILAPDPLSKSASTAVVLFDFALSSQIINEGYSILARDCHDLQHELISAGVPADVFGVWRNTRVKESPEWRSMIPFSWKCHDEQPKVVYEIWG